MRRYPLRDEDQLYFLHIPKTGGMSLMHTLFRYFPGESKEHYYPSLLLEPPERLRAQRLIVGHTFYAIRHFLDREPVYLTMLRDPVARVVSNFRHIQRVTNHPRHLTFRDSTLLEFLNTKEGESISTNMQTLSLAVDEDPRVFCQTHTPEKPWDLTPMMFAAARERQSDESLLELAKSRLQNFAFIGTTERFIQSIELLSYTFHWEPSPDVIHYNFDPERPTSIPDEAREIIVERSQLDFALHQFGRELMEQRLRDMMFDLLETDHQYRMPETTEGSRLYGADTLDLPRESLAHMRESRGWTDGWMSPRWVLSGMALPPSMKQLEIEGEVYSEYFQKPLKLTMLVGGKPIQQVEVSEGRRFTLSLPLTGEPVEILADQYFIPSQVGTSEDHRPLSWRLTSMNLKA